MNPIALLRSAWSAFQRWQHVRRSARAYDREIAEAEGRARAQRVLIERDPKRWRAEQLALINQRLDELANPPPVPKVRITREWVREHAAPPPGVVPRDLMDKVLAFDAMPYDAMNLETDYQYAFPGYPYLAQLAQVPEYRKMAGRLATEMTREFVKLRATGEGDFSDEIQQLEEDIKTFRLQEHFHKLTIIGQMFGRAHLYPDLTVPGQKSLPVYNSQAELVSRLALTPEKVPQGSLRGFRVIEPMWSYPGVYNSTDPLQPNYYTPQIWFVMAKKVHVSRLLTYIPHPVPDVLRAAYAFGGISLSQLAQPYVNNWLRTRQAVSDIVTNFSTSGLKTDLSGVLQSAFDDGISGNGPEPAGDVIKRAIAFSNFRNNRGLFVIDKDTEDFFQQNTPLGTLDKLQAQAQEQICSVCNMPLVIYTGITPAGLNANSDGEIRVWYDHVNAEKSTHYSGPFDIALKLLMLNRFGKLIPEITYEWPALYQLSDDQKAAARKTQADTDVAYINAGVFDPGEIRKARANDEDGAYGSIKGDLNDEDLETTQPDDEEEGEPSERADTRTAGAG